MKRYELWQNSWDRTQEPISIEFPDTWDVVFHDMPANHMPAMTQEQIREKLAAPIGAETIRGMAEKGHHAVIVFDDLSRGTPTQEIAEIVIGELLAGGIREKNIFFLCALGTHAPLTQADFAVKLGWNLVERFPVYNHDCHSHCKEIGKDKEGKPIEINEAFLACDVRIGIGSVSPHPMNGYGGGGKLLFPGLASLRTTAANHGRLEYGFLGSQETCGLREDINAGTRLAGQFFVIDAILNARHEIVDLFCGDPLLEHRAAMEASSRAHAMEYAGARDIVISNSNTKSDEPFSSKRVSSMAAKPGGDWVIIAHNPAGELFHQLKGQTSPWYGGPLYKPHEKRKKLPFGRVIFYTPHPSMYTKLACDEPEKLVFAKTWDEVLELLRKKYPERASVSIFSDGCIGYFPEKVKEAERK